LKALMFDCVELFYLLVVKTIYINDGHLNLLLIHMFCFTVLLICLLCIS